MRSIVFCTAYAETPLVWEVRYRRWLDAVLNGPLAPDQVLIVDDGSPVLPGWPDTVVMTGASPGEAFATGPRDGRVVLFHFPVRLGRQGLYDFPGWHRSFVFGALYAQARGFDRVVHLESDAFLVSARAHRFAREFADGWAALWVPRHDCPESAVQVAAGDGVRRLAEFAREPHAAIMGRSYEAQMPFTHVERGLVGDRYGETSDDVPAGADYAAQTEQWREPQHYWWLHGATPVARGPRVTLTLGLGGDGLDALGAGWSGPEARHHWMLGGESVVRLPPLAGDGDGAVRLRVVPHKVAGRPARQRLTIEINGERLREVEVSEECVVGARMPHSLLRKEGVNLLRLGHPDGVAHSKLDPSSGDQRRLSVSVTSIVLERA